MNKHLKLIKLIVGTALLIALGVVAFKFIHSRKSEIVIQSTAASEPSLMFA